jgi:dephospho-CoA kinase
MHVIGLTGGIGSGKSTVADLFAQYGTPIIDADQIARELVEPGQPALQRIVQTFGEEILNGNGALDRKKLRDVVFSDSKQRKQLEAILHPLIRENMLDRLDSLNAPYAILVIPLLVDTGNWEMMDRILVVDTEEELQIERVTQRDHVSQEHTETIIDNQVSRQERLAAADDVIENISSIEDLQIQVKRLHEFYLSLEQQENYRASQPQKNHSNSTPGRHWYEQPLNERIRTFLRLEHLFERATYHTNSSSEHDAHAFGNQQSDQSRRFEKRSGQGARTPVTSLEKTQQRTCRRSGPAQNTAAGAGKAHIGSTAKQGTTGATSEG